jgi:plastocyanin
VDIPIANFQFGAANAPVTINLGDTVRWTNNDPDQHTVTSGPAWGQPDHKFGSGALSQNDTFSVTFRRAGTFGYFCEFHSSMVSSIIVNPAPPKTVNVTVQNTSFGTANATTNINVGDTVQWNWVNGSHTVTSGTVISGIKTPDGLFNGNLSTISTKFTFTFSKPGLYPYYCSPHAVCCGMVSAVSVSGPIYGDVNGDGKVTASDAAEALRIWAGLTSLAPGALAMADVSPNQFGDGIVDLNDATRILRFVAGADTTPL